MALKFAIALGVLIALLTTGCRSRAIQFGIYAVPREDLSAAKDLGVDFVVGPGEQGYLDAVATHGLKALVRGNSFPKHRAVMGHYIWDEPDLFRVPPNRVKEAYEAAKKRSPKRAFLNLSSGFAIEYYRRHADVLMFDWYPVGWRPVETYYSHLRVARLASQRKPFFAVVQAFDWSRYPKLMPRSDQYRAPSAAEVKAMSVWAAMEGASGIVYYPYDDGHYSIRTNQEVAMAIKVSVDFIRLYDSYFTGRRAWGPYPFRYPNAAEGTNALLAPAIAARYTQLDKRSNHLVLIAANTTERVVEAVAVKEIEIPATGPIRFEPYEIKMFPAKILPRAEVGVPQEKP